MTGQEPQAYHLSFGSATNGVHVSTDLLADDPELINKSDAFIDYAQRMNIIGTRLQNQIKGK